MSYLSPAQYHNIAQELGKSYKEIRDSLLGTNTSTAINNALTIVLDAPDAVTQSVSVDPKGSIAKDLGGKFSDLSAKFTVDTATRIASAYFSDAISSMNTHVVARVNTAGTKSYSNIAAFFDGNAAYWKSDTVNHYSYFSNEFREMCGYLGVTFSADYARDNGGAYMP